MLALNKFVEETGYIPVRTEVMVYSDRFQVGGMLDDLGVMKHNGKWRFVLMDLKTSNQMKPHYWLQVALYNLMFTEITGLKPEAHFILKVSKDYPQYNIEHIEDMRRVIAGAKSVLKVHDVMGFIREKRKDIGKTVIKI
jgi:hypothetical protein